MRVPDCPHEESILRAVKSGQWEDFLQAHVVTCLICQEVVKVSRYLEALSVSPENESPLPNPGQIWWRAQRLEKQAKMERATRPILIFQNIALTAAALFLFALVVWRWSQVEVWLSRFSQTWLQASYLFGWRFTALFLLLSMTLGIVCLTLIMSLFTVFAEE
jgi:hypothetical protein